jgi:hypothetical protein
MFSITGLLCATIITQGLGLDAGAQRLIFTGRLLFTLIRRATRTGLILRFNNSLNDSAVT